MSETALTRDTAITMAENRSADHLRAGTQFDLLLLRRRAGLSPWRPSSRRRHVRDRLFRLSGLPRRHHQGHAGRAHAGHGPAHDHPYPADVDRQGRDFFMAEDIGGAAFLDIILEDTHSCYRGERARRHDWGYGCGDCPACKLRAQGFAKFMARNDFYMNNETQSKYRRHDFSGAVLPHRPCGELADRPCRHNLRS